MVRSAISALSKALRKRAASSEQVSRMARIPIIDRAAMNAEQARVYDEAKQSSGIVGGPYYAYIRLTAPLSMR